MDNLRLILYIYTVKALICRCTFPYLSFFRIARAASVGLTILDHKIPLCDPNPVSCNRIDSIKSGMPTRSSSSYCSDDSRSNPSVSKSHILIKDLLPLPIPIHVSQIASSYNTPSHCDIAVYGLSSEKIPILYCTSNTHDYSNPSSISPTIAYRLNDVSEGVKGVLQGFLFGLCTEQP